MVSQVLVKPKTKNHPPPPQDSLVGQEASRSAAARAAATASYYLVQLSSRAGEGAAAAYFGKLQVGRGARGWEGRARGTYRACLCASTTAASAKPSPYALMPPPALFQSFRRFLPPPHLTSALPSSLPPPPPQMELLHAYDPRFNIPGRPVSEALLPEASALQDSLLAHPRLADFGAEV